jgi:hypothetical protein
MVRYTLRDIPEELDLLVREKAVKQNTSINKTVISLIQKGLGKEEKRAVRYHDLDDLSGTWKEDPDFDEAIADQDRIEEAVWD